MTAAGFDSPAAAARSARGLRCEYLVDPLGIQETAPRLTWIMNSKRRGERQTAYRVLVASTPELLAQGKGDRWDSGRVESDQSAHVAYHGKPLRSRDRCYWSVRIWDRDGSPGPWSKPAIWSIGLLDSGEWTARWITAPSITTSAGSRPAPIIRRAVYEATDGAGSRDVTAAVKAAMRDGDLNLTVGNEALGGDPAFQHVKQLRVEYEAGGKPETAIAREGEVFTLQATARATPYLRRSFTVTKPVRRASLYATALGVYEMHLNGRRVGNQLLAPGWTDYRRRVRYQEYDVTPLLRAGENAIGAMAAHGWYSGHLGNGGYQFYGKTPEILAQLEVTYADGTTERIVTDTAWKMHAGPILASDLMLGESYDSRQEIQGWDEPELDDQNWLPVVLDDRRGAPAANPPVEAQIEEPVRALGEVRPIRVTEPAKGRWTYDLGQNMVGVVRLKIAAPAGTRLTLRHAEMLNPDGTLYTTNLRSATSVDTFVSRGAGVETWQPRFTFHGFRYVELTGVSQRPPMNAVTGIVIGSDTPRAGRFACSDARVNKLQSNIEWGQRGNYLSVPTDCPQRDERMGWMGDAEVFVRTATCNSDVAAFFTKWMVDVDDAQTKDGAFSDTSPSYGGGGTPAWADAGVICPWTIYLADGDKRILERHLPAMTRWVEWCRAHSTNLIRDKDRNGDYGDWLSIGADTPKDVIGTAYFAYSTGLLARAYAAVGDRASAEKYRRLFDDIRTAFNRQYVQPDGRIKGDTQCCYAMALRFDLLPSGLRPKAAEYLVADIKKRGDHLSTGFVGVSYLLPVLTAAGRADVAYRLLMQDTFPSWLFSVKQGATTIWERWDGWTPDKGFQDPGMNSFNHYSLGSCGEWLYGSVAGIDFDPAEPGYKHIILHPRVNGPIAWVNGHHDSIYGRIESNWRREGDTVTMKIVIPPNTHATAYVPTADAHGVSEGAMSANQSPGVRFVRYEDGAAVYELESGAYNFKATLK